MLDLIENQYYEEDTLAYQLQYSSSTPDYTIPHLEGQKSHPVTQMAITPLPLTQQMYSTGTHGVEGGEPYYTAIDYMERKPDQWKVERPERDGQIINRGYEN